MLLKTIKINKKLVDCFYGDGWENWSRWYTKPDGTLVLVGGIEPPAIYKNELFKKGIN